MKIIQKITSLFISIIFIFAFVACNSNNLNDYKETAKGKIDEHVATKAEADYSAANWSQIGQIVAEGKAAIDNAMTKTQVDTVVENTKDAINEVDKLCDGISLFDYKIAKSNELQYYAVAKGLDNYSEDNWSAICDAVIAGKQAIEDATTKLQVDTVVMNAKQTINAVPREAIGVFYTLQEAYDEGLLSVDDLQSIAVYYNDGTYPENTLSEIMTKEIKKTYRESVINMPTASLERINLYKYYGTYNESIAVGITDNYFLYDYVIIKELNVAGVFFYNIHIACILIWSA